MKKITLALMAVMLVLGMTQCKKEQTIPTPEPTPDGEVVYISMKVDDGGKHIVYPGTGAYVFEDGDKIYVGNNGHYVGTLTYGNGTFSGSITSPSTSDYLHFYFTGGKAPADAPTAGSTTSFTVNISDQTSKLPILSYGRSHIKYVNGTTAYGCMLENQCGLVKFVPIPETPNTIRVSGMKTTATINFATPGITPTNTSGEVTLYSVNDSEKWAVLLPQNQVENTEVTVENENYGMKIEQVPPILNNMYYTTGVNIIMSAPTGAIRGLFTINDSGDQVFFSQGNLQYIGSAATPYWQFAEHQWDLIDHNNYSNLEDVWDNSPNIDRDLFCWATSGWNCGNTYYQPWHVNHFDQPKESAYGYGPLPSGSSWPDLTGDYAHADWGVHNAIRNGGNQAGLWRTPSSSEWYYLAGDRNTSSGIRYALATVNGMKGMILLPDNWNPSIHELINYNVMNVATIFSDNIINVDDWNTMEAYGAVFLPCSNFWEFYDFSEYDGPKQFLWINGRTHYWSSSHSGGAVKGTFTFASNTSAGAAYNGLPVRLVQDAQ